MSSARSSKRQKLQHPGSRSNPIQISDDETGSEAGDLSTAASEPDSLRPLLFVLDTLNRDEHLGMILERARVANTSQNTLKTLLDSSTVMEPGTQPEPKIVRSGTGDDTTLQVETTSNGQTIIPRNETSFLQDHPTAGPFPSLQQIEHLMYLPGRALMSACRLSEAVHRWAKVLDNLYSLWESLWNIYDAMTKPGPSSRPLKIRMLWEEQNPPMLQDLERIVADVQIAEGELDKLAEAVLTEAAAHVSQG
ncbi:hypothetical protein AYL99_08584 [Fonsecaea erecta]|uniref:Uncharacterized protein n=1 Tax=Fonsecaea erecta TaxID=1367422 RepID=A0A178ZED5_9EURO|nr:hypothetical protein AYL99_08584 [Fonsecaea erecta]OAP57846.1 hypothetical protein AYL99_08584 [Fonsecaea erecta]